MSTSFEGIDSILSRNSTLRQRLTELLDMDGQANALVPGPSEFSSSSQLHQRDFSSAINSDHSQAEDKALSNADVVITANEVNSRHGTGVLVQKFFSEASNVFSIRAHNHFNGEHSFGDISLLLSSKGLSRPDLYRTVLEAFGNSTAKRVVCIPFDADEVRTAIAVKDVFDIPLCTYIMDDNNVHSSGIPDSLMKELLKKSSLRLAISPELQQAYQQKYNIKFWILPPIVSSNLVLDHATTTPTDMKKGILVGNIWGQRWLDLLRQSIRDSGFTIDWYCNSAEKCSWLTFDRKELENEGIFLKDPLPEAELAVLLQQYSFALLPSGTLDEQDDNRSVAQLSLPTRVPFIMATSHTPIVVLGSEKTASGRFVKRFQIGTVSPYESSRFQEAVEMVTSAENQALMRQNARQIARDFSDDGILDWIWTSLENGQPIDKRFEALMPPREEDVPYYIDPPAPTDIFWGFVPDYQAIERLRDIGFNPDFVVDVGASTGIWSDTIARLLPNARFILVEPLLSLHDDSSKKFFIDSHPNFETVEAAVSNEVGRASFQVSSDLYGSSLLVPGDRTDYQTVDVEVITLDVLAQRNNLIGRGFLKVDVQCAEHLVLEGGKELLQKIDAIQLELSLIRLDERAKIFIEMIQFMEQEGFRYFDDVGYWRSAIDGGLVQKDVLFLRKGFLE